jgi:hypothetical protein
MTAERRGECEGMTGGKVRDGDGGGAGELVREREKVRALAAGVECDDEPTDEGMGFEDDGWGTFSEGREDFSDT